MEVLTFIFDKLAALLSWVLFILPDSPFQLIDKTPIAKYLPWINWFIPLNFAVTTLTLWLIAIGTYYAYSIFLRWLKAVE